MTPTLKQMIHTATKKYYPGTDRQVAAQNLLLYGMLGYAVPVDRTSMGFCDNENIAQNPGAVPPQDVPRIVQAMAHTLRDCGQSQYACRVETCAHSNWFKPGRYRS